ncbi:MAG: sulfur carrier protein ThiS [Muribaculaceae bacterium]|nr:sulfur carrier protein ThiS [Muribaculaceae bacterium]
MKIILNNILTTLPSELMTVAEFVEWKGIKPAGTAIAVNDRIVRKELWVSTSFQELDRVTVISAAFGG